MSERDNRRNRLPFGQWPSTISATLVASGNPRLAEPRVHNNTLFWLQGIAEEKGRVAIRMKALNKANSEVYTLLPRPLSAKSKVHEYGGGSYTLAGQSVYFVLADDQRIYRADIPEQPATNDKEFIPEAISPLAKEGVQRRYADLTYDQHSDSLLAVCEEHAQGFAEARNTLVSIHIESGQQTTIAAGDDFYSNPVLSPCGSQLAWLSWKHPDMPWDASELWLGTRDSTGHFSKENAIRLAGNNGGNESIFLPRFHANGDLFFVSDRTEWWNIYRIEKDDLQQQLPPAQTVCEMAAEFATPQWLFAMSTYDFLDEQTLIATCTQNGEWQLLQISLANPASIVKPLEVRDALEFPLSRYSDIYANGEGQACFLGASPAIADDVYFLGVNNSVSATLKKAPALGRPHIAMPKAICFDTGDGEKAHAFYYPPTHADYFCDTEKPPMIVICHGGPTGASDTAFNAKIQYWTNRGFAVMDVNYRGSTGFGRRYRHALHYQWGIYDVQDVCAAADYACQQGWADKNKLIIKGSSAGGYTVLAALAFRDTFKAGVSLYGIGDLETLVRDTHKFEARYLDRLVGDYNTQHSEYIARSPIHSVEQINCPLLIFQGLEDKVVPPNQAQAMVDAVSKKGLTVEYVTFADEGHGFRNGANIELMLEKELAFYQSVFAL